MDLTMHRQRTRQSWEAMRSRFRAEWRDGFDTIQSHQFRVTRQNGVHDGWQVTQYFAAHGKRIAEERWPEFKEVIK